MEYVQISTEEFLTQRESKRETENKRLQERDRYIYPNTERNRVRKRRREKRRDRRAVYLAFIYFTGTEVLGWHHASRGHNANQLIKIRI